MPSTCVLHVDFQRIQRSTTIGQTSTVLRAGYQAAYRTVGKVRSILQFLNTFATTLSTRILRLSPLVNTFFTQFPQPLLLERQKKRLRKVS